MMMGVVGVTAAVLLVARVHATRPTPPDTSGRSMITPSRDCTNEAASAQPHLVADLVNGAAG